MSANLRILAGDTAEYFGNNRAKFCRKIVKSDLFLSNFWY